MSVSHSMASETELVITRTYDAPRQLVYDAWTRAEHLERWQGAPKGMTVTITESDLRTGGRFRLNMKGADGTDHWLSGAYRDVTPPERLVFTHVWLDARNNPGPQTLVTLTLVEQGTRTVLTLRQTGFTSTESRDGHHEGWTSTLDRLEEFLGGRSPK